MKKKERKISFASNDLTLCRNHIVISIFKVNMWTFRGLRKSDMIDKGLGVERTCPPVPFQTACHLHTLPVSRLACARCNPGLKLLSTNFSGRNLPRKSSY